MKKVLVVGDLHAPFHCDDTVRAIYSAAQRHKPDAIVQVGDCYDFFSYSRFPKIPGKISPDQELEEGYEFLCSFWSALKKAAPRASLYGILGNHCIRPLKLSAEKSPELYSLVNRSWKELFKFKGVSMLMDPRDDLVLDGVVYEHGFYSQPGRHLKENMRPTVIGHTHRPWIHYEKIRSDLLWELNVGYAADPTHDALSYPRKRWIKWVKGYGLIENGMPHFYPLDVAG